MQEYKPNSRLAKEREADAAKDRKVEKVVSGNVKRRENKGRKFLGTFIAGDANSVWETILMDVLVPSFKKLISEGITTAADLFIYGESRGRGRSRSDSKVSYRSYYDDRYGDRRDSDTREVRRNRFDFDDLLFDDRGTAEIVLDHMHDTIKRYGFVTVADMYDMADVTAPYTSNKYGWTNLRTADVKRVRDGYIIELPKAMPID